MASGSGVGRRPSHVAPDLFSGELVGLYPLFNHNIVGDRHQRQRSTVDLPGLLILSSKVP